MPSKVVMVLLRRKMPSQSLLPLHHMTPPYPSDLRMVACRSHPQSDILSLLIPQAPPRVNPMHRFFVPAWHIFADAGDRCALLCGLEGFAVSRDGSWGIVGRARHPPQGRSAGGRAGACQPRAFGGQWARLEMTKAESSRASQCYDRMSDRGRPDPKPNLPKGGTL